MKRSMAIVALINFCVVFAASNKVNSEYYQSNQQLLAQQKNNNNKMHCYYNTGKNVFMKQPRKFNHIPRGNKSDTKVRYR